MKQIEVANRKMTTSAGLNALAELVEKLESKMCGDLQNFGAKKTFFCRVEENNGLFTNDFNYLSWTMYTGQFVYRDGYIKIKVSDDCHKDLYITTGKTSSGDRTWYDYHIEKINFADAVASLEEIVAEYNTKAIEKDAEIEKFLNLSHDFLKQE